MKWCEPLMKYERRILHEWRDLTLSGPFRGSWYLPENKARPAQQETPWGN